jgi:hypothetical protein
MQKETTDINDTILADLGSRKARGLDIDVHEIIGLIDFTKKSYTRIKDWILDEKITTKSEWNKALQNQEIKNFLGRYPQSATEYLNLWLKKNEIKIDYKRRISHHSKVFHNGIDVHLELIKLRTEIQQANPVDILKLKEQERTFQDLINCKTIYITTEDLSRNMRIKAKELGLGFNARDIDDVIQAWIKAEQPNRKYEIFQNIVYRPAIASSKICQDMWKKMIYSSFDIDEMQLEVVEGIIRKFMWQVKRKIQDLEVTNHLMPVLLGPQGVGKTTWMNRLVAPLGEITASTDFSQVTDDRNIDIWDNYVLILDEMGYASKADIEVVKNIISSGMLLRRVMRSNNAITARQNATFIGASNRELDQLIRDETGIRRFIGLRFSKKPDWIKMNDIDFGMLWQSVDELGPDPLNSYREVMKDSQETSRIMSPCEEWVYAMPDSYKNTDYKGGSQWFRIFKDWEREHYERHRLDFDDWSKELRRLIRNTADFPFKVQVKGRGHGYMFTGNKKI